MERLEEKSRIHHLAVIEAPANGCTAASASREAATTKYHELFIHSPILRLRNSLQ